MYREVCSTCHSIKFVAFRNLIGVSHSEAEVRTGLPFIYQTRFYFVCRCAFASGELGVGVAENEQRGIKWR